MVRKGLARSDIKIEAVLEVFQRCKSLQIQSFSVDLNAEAHEGTIL